MAQDSLPEVYWWSHSVLGRDTEIKALCERIQEERIAIVSGWVGRGKRSVAGAVAHKLLVAGALEGGVLTVCMGEQSTKGYGVQELRNLVQLQATIFTQPSYQAPRCALDSWLCRLSSSRRGLLVLERCNSTMEELESLLLITLQQSEHVMVLVTSSYISSSWRQHGWYVVELEALPLAVAVQILQHAARDAGQQESLGARKAKELCTTLCPHLDPVIIKAIGYVLGAGYTTAQALLDNGELPAIRDEALVKLARLCNSERPVAALTVSLALSAIIFEGQLEAVGVKAELREAALSMGIIRSQAIASAGGRTHNLYSLCEGFNNLSMPSEWDLSVDGWAVSKQDIAKAARDVIKGMQEQLTTLITSHPAQLCSALHHALDISAVWAWRCNDLGDDCLEAVLQLAAALQEQGQLSEAVHLYLRSFQTASSSQAKQISDQRYRLLSDACLPFLQCCNLLDQPVLALRCLDDCLAHEWGLLAYMLERCRLHIKIGHMHKAASILKALIRQCREAEQADHSSLLCEGQVLLGLCYLGFQQPGEAEKVLREASRDAYRTHTPISDLPKLYPALLAFCLVDQGKQAEAVESARHLETTLSNTTDLRAFYVQLGLASSLAAQNDLEQARKVADTLQLPLFMKAHHRFGPYFAHQVVIKLHQLGTTLEDLSAGLNKCSIIRCAMDTATVSLAAWQLLRNKVEPYSFPQRIYHSRGASVHNLGLVIATIAVATGETKWQQYGSRLLSTMVGELESIQLDQQSRAGLDLSELPDEDAALIEARRQLALVQQRPLVQLPKQAQVFQAEQCVLCKEKPATTGISHGDSVHCCCCKRCAAEVMLTDDPCCPVCGEAVTAVIISFKQEDQDIGCDMDSSNGGSLDGSSEGYSSSPSNQ